MLGWGRWLKDKFLVMNDLPRVKTIYYTNRKPYVDGVDALITTITQDTRQTIDDCKKTLADAKTQVDKIAREKHQERPRVGEEVRWPRRTVLRQRRVMYFMDVALNPGTKPDELGAAVEKLGGTFAQEVPQGELQLHELIWTLPDGRGNVRYVYDHFVDVATARAESAKFGEPGEILLDLSKHTDVFDVSQMRKLVNSNDPGIRTYALGALAVITARFRGDVFDVFCAALESPDTSMRWVAMKCIARWPYFQFAARLRAHAKKEPDEALRKEAERLAADIVAHGKRG